MNDRAEPVLTATLEHLVEAGKLTREQADAVRTDFRADLGAELQSVPPSDLPRGVPGDDTPWSLILTEVGGYVGAAFVTAAAIALVGPNWDRFSQPVRVGLLAGPALLLLLAAFSVVTGQVGGWSVRAVAAERHRLTGPRRRLVSTLVLAGGGLLGAATAVLVQDTASVDHWISLVPLAVWGTGYLLWRGVGLHLGTSAALAWTALSVLGGDLDDRWPLSGLLLVLAGVGWAALTRRRMVAEQMLGIAVAGVMAFTGGENVVFSDYEGFGYLLLGLLAAGGLFVYLRTRELGALGVGAGTLAVVVPQAVIHYTDGSLNAAGALLVSGLSVVAVSVLASRLRRAGSGPAQIV
jgi:hypothetical protein